MANSQIYVRAIGDLDARLLTRTGSVRGPVQDSSCFLPDGRSIAYVEQEGEQDAIKRIEITGGAPVTVCRGLRPTAPLLEWRGDSIFFSTRLSWRHWRHHARGGVRRTARADHPARTRREVATKPQMLDDGRVLFAVGPSQGSLAVDWSKGRIVVQRPGEKTRTTLVEGGTDPRYLSSGHLIYQLNGVLYARTFDPSRMAVGGAVSVVEGVFRGIGWVTVAWYAVSDSGTLVYLPGPVDTGGSAELTIALFDRAGKAEPLPVKAGAVFGAPHVPRWPPDCLWL